MSEHRGWLTYVVDHRWFAEFVRRVSYKPGWRFEVDGSALRVSLRTNDSLTGRLTVVTHVRPLPWLPEEGREKDARWWLFRTVCEIEQHEAAEFFAVDGLAPFWPDHDEPYALNERAEADWVPVNAPSPLAGE